MNNTTKLTEEELHKQILKAALVRSSVQRWEKGADEPIEASHQCVVEIGIDDLMQLITTHIAKRVAAYHNDITDNERKVWLYSEDLQRRLLDARLDELGAVGYFSGVGLVHYNDDGSTVRKLELRIEDLEDERQKLEEKL